jgi:hypothetical protein
MPKIELSDGERSTVAALLRRAIDEDRYPLSSLRSALAKLDPRPAKPPSPRGAGCGKNGAFVAICKNL